MRPFVSTLVIFQDAAGRVGCVEVTTLPLPSTATHKPVEGQTPLRPPPPPRLAVVQADAPPIGAVEGDDVTVAVHGYLHKPVEGQDIPVIPSIALSTCAVIQADVPPSGSVEVTTLPTWSTAAQRPVEGHEIAVIEASTRARPLACTARRSCRSEDFANLIDCGTEARRRAGDTVEAGVAYVCDRPRRRAARRAGPGDDVAFLVDRGTEVRRRAGDAVHAVTPVTRSPRRSSAHRGRRGDDVTRLVACNAKARRRAGDGGDGATVTGGDLGGRPRRSSAPGPWT